MNGAEGEFSSVCLLEWDSGWTKHHDPQKDLDRVEGWRGFVTPSLLESLAGAAQNKGEDSSPLIGGRCQPQLLLQAVQVLLPQAASCEQNKTLKQGSSFSPICFFLFPSLFTTLSPRGPLSPVRPCYQENTVINRFIHPFMWQMLLSSINVPGWETSDWPGITPWRAIFLKSAPCC